MVFSSNLGENHCNSKLLRGFSTKSWRKIRGSMSQEECSTALDVTGQGEEGLYPAFNAFVRKGDSHFLLSDSVD